MHIRKKEQKLKIKTYLLILTASYPVSLFIGNHRMDASISIQRNSHAYSIHCVHFDMLTFFYL